MCGRPLRDDSAQLALLDAMVFFAAALLVSGMMFSQRAADGRDESAPFGLNDPIELLGALMRASVGRQMELPTDPRVELTGYEEFSEVLAFELDELRSGTLLVVFTEFNEVLCDALLAACTPALEPHLVAFGEDGSLDEPLVGIPRPPDIASIAYAGSMTLPGRSGAEYVVVLVLDPALPPERGGV